MLEFSKSEKTEMIENNLENPKFVEKCPENEKIKETKLFWDHLFNENLYDEDEIHEVVDDVYADVFGIDEDSFSFDYDVNDPDISNILDQFAEHSWNELPEIESYVCENGALC